MINSPKVYIDIWRLYSEVGHKNILIVGYKNHLVRLITKTK
jgi:hypothetical protein